MNESIIEAFKKSLETGFIDKSISSEFLYQPELLVNSKRPPLKVLTSIIQELENCEEFFISVAFATTGGVAALMNHFKLLETRNIKGKLLVSQYLNFTQPEALRRLSKFKNIELRIAVGSNSHTKGYIFKSKKYYNLIIGSSNLTQTALSTNKEWNLKVSAIGESGLVEKVLKEFNNDFENGIAVTATFIENYEEVYRLNFNQKNLSKVEDIQLVETEVVPNRMQEEALSNLHQLREKGETKALLISATGTGKTFLSAFDAKSFNPKKLLFVVHRLNIAEKAMKSFKKIFGSQKSMGVYSGDRKELEADFIFSTVQTISKENHFGLFFNRYFDYIIIDESHRSGAASYLRLLEYFKPQFLLGMTATPERTDGSDIFSLFNHNIAYEIRLHKAMEENMLSPFHYYGVTELFIEAELREDESEFRFLNLDDRAANIIEKIEFYGCDDGVIRGLVFCGTNNESKELSDEFNKRGYKTLALSGENSEKERVTAIERLESKNSQEKLDYIFTVDIFNEGIDIPTVNQVIMIRPTESAIIFVQQLGRGLRKVDNKQYLTVIDFIGNYKNNYLIPIALYGDTSYNKDSLRKLISEGSKMIPGASTINFDEISKEKIYQSIDSAKFDYLKELRDDYNLLKFKLGRIPMMKDFLESGARDPYMYVAKKKSYFNFVKYAESETSFGLSRAQEELLELFSAEINNAKRIEETILLSSLIESKSISSSEFKNLIFEKYSYMPTDETIASCLNNLNFNFVKKERKIVNGSTRFVVSKEFESHLKNKTFNKFLIDSIQYAITTYNKEFDLEKFKDGFLLYKKYTRKDVCRILNWPANWESTVYGYKIYENSVPLFVTYKKSADISASTKYNDRFISKNVFAWESKSQRKLDSTDVRQLIESEGSGLRILLFVQKSNDEGTDFYYMGDLDVIKESVDQGVKDKDNGGTTSVVHFNFKMQTTVQDNIYDYLVEKHKIKEMSKAEILNPANDSFFGKTTIQVKQLTLFENAIPFYDFYAAAGTFSEMQTEKNYSLLEIEEKYSRDDYFACEVRGESMNRRIESGSICLFKKDVVGSRNGKIVLVENFDRQDPDFHSAFTVKKYTSQKEIADEGWVHTRITLSPNSYDNSYKDIIINKENGANVNVIGEFVKVLEQPS